MTSWVYSQSTGQLWNSDGRKEAVGYSGHGEGKNNPGMQPLKNVGPIPRGMWLMAERYNSKKIGPAAIVLEPVDHDMLGRSYFRIHGDSRSNPGSASHGCIIFGPGMRNMMWLGKSKLLRVIE